MNELTVSAVILAGGAGSRLGGVDKAMLEHDGMSLLARMVNALANHVEQIVIVGRPRELNIEVGVPIIWTLEDPAGGGPLAGLEAGIRAIQATAVENPASEHCRNTWVFAFACDQPYAERAIKPLLAAASKLSRASTPREGVIGTDYAGRFQALTALYRMDSVVSVLDKLGATAGLPMRALTKNLDLVTTPLPHGASQDVDTPEDLMSFGMARPQRRQNT